MEECLAVRFWRLGTKQGQLSQGPFRRQAGKLGRRYHDARWSPQRGATRGPGDRYIVTGYSLQSLALAAVILTVNARCTASEICEKSALRNRLRTSGERCAVQQQIGLRYPPYSSLASAGNGCLSHHLNAATTPSSLALLKTCLSARASMPRVWRIPCATSSGSLSIRPEMASTRSNSTMKTSNYSWMLGTGETFRNPPPHERHHRSFIVPIATQAVT